MCAEICGLEVDVCVSKQNQYGTVLPLLLFTWTKLLIIPSVWKKNAILGLEQVELSFKFD